MEFFRIKKDIPFMRYAIVLNIISFLTFIIACFFLIQRGLNLSIEFTGGTVMEVSYEQQVDLELIRNSINQIKFAGKPGNAQVQNFGTTRDVIIRLPLESITKDNGGNLNAGGQNELIMQTLQAIDPSARLQRVEFVGPQVGKELAVDGLIALLAVISGIMLYLSLRFEWKFAVAGIIANLHDVIIILGCFAFFQWEFSLSVLAAVLAVLGYSVNESVVIFDRVRENFRKYRKMLPTEIIDSAITGTISRTIITHGSTQMMVLAMLFFGGASLHYFALALTIGILFGIYSSVFVAAAIAMWLGIKRDDLVKINKNDETTITDDGDPHFGAQV